MLRSLVKPIVAKARARDSFRLSSTHWRCSSVMVAAGVCKA
jgi:hypothetical protein